MAVFGNYQQVTLAGTRRAAAEHGGRRLRRLATGICGWAPTKARSASMGSASPSSTRAPRPGIGASFVTSLLERRDGDLWLATYGGGARASPVADSPVTVHDGLSSDLGLVPVRRPGGDALDRHRWRQRERAPARAASPNTRPPMACPGNLVRAVIDDRQGGLLVGTNRGIAQDCRRSRASLSRGARTWRMPMSAPWPGSARRIALGGRHQR